MANELPKRFFDKGNLATLWTKFKTWLTAYTTRLEKKHFPDDTDNITVRKSVPANADFGNDNTTYGQGTGITIDYQNNIHNAGVRSISAGSSAGTLTVDTNGRSETVTVPHCSSVVNNVTAGTNVGSINVTKNGNTTAIAVIPSDAKLTDTTYSAGSGISINGTTINNTGVRSISAGSSVGQLSINTGGNTSTITVPGSMDATKLCYLRLGRMSLDNQGGTVEFFANTETTDLKYTVSAGCEVVTATNQTKHITFSTPFRYAPVVVVSPQRSQASYTWITVSNATTTGFDITSNSYNANNWCTGYYWIAIGRIA